jgi:predicted RNA binding protein YcfA (HicA-like mRNA interferase family)
MSQWGSAKARKVLGALPRIGWTIKRESRGSHRILSRPGWPDVVFVFHDGGRDRPPKTRLPLQLNIRVYSCPFVVSLKQKRPIGIFQTGRFELN